MLASYTPMKIAALAAAAAVLAASTVRSDCGQIVVVTRVHVNVGVRVVSQPWYPPPTPVIPYPGPTSVITNQSQSQSQSTQVNPNPVFPTPGTVVASQPTIAAYRHDVPEWSSVAASKFAGKGIRTFEEPRQLAVIAWNGKEQILTLMTEQKAFTGSGAVLSVLPLPGRPIKIEEGDKNLFANASAAIAQKLVGAAKKPIIAEAKIGAHNIFVVEADSVDQFVKEVEEYVSKKFGKDAQPMMTSDIRDLLVHYQGLGFRYFAFDLMLNTPELEMKQAIKYHFESDFVYYPLYISRAGGTGATTVEAVVFTPSGLNQVRRGSLPADQIESTTGVRFDAAELATLHKDLADLMGPNGALGRKWTIKGNLNTFAGDVMMKP